MIETQPISTDFNRTQPNREVRGCDEARRERKEKGKGNKREEMGGKKKKGKGELKEIE